MRRVLVCLVLIACSFSVLAHPKNPCSHHAQLSFGMVPVVSSNLIELWASILEQKITRNGCIKLSFSSSKDFQHYIQKAKSGAFDVLTAPAHISSYLIKHAGFKPVAFLVWESTYLYVVPNESNITSIDHKAAKTFALPDPLSEASILAQLELAAHGQTIKFQHHQHHRKIISTLLTGQADVGVVLSPFYNGYKKHQAPKVRPIHESVFPSHGMLIAAPHTTGKDRKMLFDALAKLGPNAGLFWQRFEGVKPAQLEQLHLDQAETVEFLLGVLGE